VTFPPVGSPSELELCLSSSMDIQGLTRMTHIWYRLDLLIMLSEEEQTEYF